MRKKTFTLLATALSIMTVSAVAVSFLTSEVGKNFLSLKADVVPNRVSITRTSGWVGTYDASTITATTEKGNPLVFGAENLDIRNGSADYENCVVFDASRGASILWNKTEIYGITSIKISNYIVGSPDDYSSPFGGSFTVFYGYEEIDFDNANYVAKEVITNGVIEFEEGYEPSYFGLLAGFSHDACFSKIEINYQCEQVEGDFVNSSEAKLYNAKGKYFEYENGNRVLVEQTEAAPLAHASHVLNNRVPSLVHQDKITYFEPSTQSWTPTQDDHIALKRADDKPIAERVGRDTILITFMVSKADGYTGWGGASDVYIGVNRNYSDAFYSRIFTQNTAADAQSWTSHAAGFEIYDAETGVPVTGPIWDVKVTVEFSVASVADVKNIHLGTSNGYQKFTVYDISFRDNCAHANVENVSTGYSSVHVCERCGKVVDSFIDNLSYFNYSGKSSDNFTYETGVTFDGRENCLHTHSPVKTNYEEGGWAQNYQLRFTGLIDNVRAAGLTTIKLHIYVKSESTDSDVRFTWGLWNKTSNRIEAFASFDHWNAPVHSGGVDATLAVNMVTSVLLENGQQYNPSRPNTAAANRWVLVTMDVSSDAYANLELYLSPCYYGNDTPTYPIDVYVSEIEVLP